MSDSLTLTAPSAWQSDLAKWDKPLADFKARYAKISTTDKEQYEPRRLAISEMRKTRGLIEERRLELTRPLLKAQKDIKAKGDWLVAEIEKIEEPLRLANKLIDEAVEKARKEAEQDERDKAQAAERAAFEALAAERDRIRKEQEAANREIAEKAAVQRALHDAEAKAAREECACVLAENNRQREALAAEQKKFRDQQEATAKIERDRLAKIEAERVAKEAAEQAEVQRVTDELARVECERIEAERREAMKPDIQKVRDFAAIVEAIIEQAPNVTSDEAFTAVTDALAIMAVLANKLRDFGE